jgi:hypothetical protein
LGNPQSLNKYQYTYNNPLNMTDPSGHCPPIIVAGIIIAVACLTNPDYAVAPTGRETPEQMDEYRTTYGSGALLDLIPLGVGGKVAGKIFKNVFGKAIFKGSQTVVSKGSNQVVKQTVKNTPNITKPYKRPSGATTKAQRKSVQGKSCVDCGKKGSKMVADHKNPLVKEYYKTGKIDKKRMRDIKSVQPQCPTCSAKQGARLSRYSKEMKKKIKQEE